LSREARHFKSRKKPAAAVIICVIVIAAVIFGLWYWMGHYREGVLIKKNVTKVGNMEKGDVNGLESSIAKIDASMKHLSRYNASGKAGLRHQFENTVIMGDSITEGLVSYDMLGTDVVVYRRGASLSGSFPLISKAKGLDPKVVFLSFGTNDLITYRGASAPYIKEYRKFIKRVKKSMPDAKICINGILPIQRSAINRQHSLGAYPKFNAALKKMCSDMGLIFIDNGYIVREHPKFYAGDGIHQSAAFYPLWLSNMADRAGL